MQLTLTLLQRDRVAIIISLAGITLLAWAYLVVMASNMPSDDMMSNMQIQEWNTSYFLMMFLMWAIMMIGMMIPSVTPMVLIYAAVARKSENQGSNVTSTSAFVSGYVAIWVVFSLIATIVQWALDRAALLSPMMVTNSVLLGTALLIAAGIYQLLPIKDVCLRQCRSPVDFIATHWQAGTVGAFKMGLSHGIFCLGCCWVLMSLLFLGGVMNILWIAIITLFILLEKILPYGDVGGRAVGIIMIITGGFFIFVGGYGWT